MGGASEVWVYVWSGFGCEHPGFHGSIVWTALTTWYVSEISWARLQQTASKLASYRHALDLASREVLYISLRVV
eukprot:5996637-Amphidinium_carterae.1